MSTKLRNVLMRVFRTFCQAAIPVFLVTAVRPLQDLWSNVVNWASGTDNLDTANVDALRAALVTVIAAGLVACFSLVWNLFNDYLRIGNNWALIGKPTDTKIGEKVLDPSDTNSTAIIDGEPVNPK